MARTKASACRKSSGKATQKAISSSSISKAIMAHSGSKGSSSGKKSKTSSSTINGICQRPTPEWQKKITGFMKNEKDKGTSSQDDEMQNAEDNALPGTSTDNSSSVGTEDVQVANNGKGVNPSSGEDTGREMGDSHEDEGRKDAIDKEVDECSDLSTKCNRNDACDVNVDSEENEELDDEDETALEKT